MGGINSGRRADLGRTMSPTLRAIMKASPVPLGKLAVAAGFHSGQLYDWLAGKNDPSVTRVEALAQAAGCRIIVLPAAEGDLLDALGYEVIVRRKSNA